MAKSGLNVLLWTVDRCDFVSPRYSSLLSAHAFNLERVTRGLRAERDSPRLGALLRLSCHRISLARSRCTVCSMVYRATTNRWHEEDTAIPRYWTLVHIDDRKRKNRTTSSVNLLRTFSPIVSDLSVIGEGAQLFLFLWRFLNTKGFSIWDRSIF